MATIFTKIIRGEIPCYKVAESEKYFAFLDINPLTAGHTLVVPKKETDYIFDLGDDDYSGLMLFAKKIALGIEKAIPCARIGVAVVGLEVPHTHIHLVPINAISDLNFANPKMKMTHDEFEKIALRISEKIIL
ncbi:MAG: HIT domain-containing protein [Bacteroidales bacterium]|nr:HIT domain-containing protein [Bacteroidales bacterium]